MEAIIAFLSSHKAIIGAVASILEGIVALINLWRKFKATKGEVRSMSASPSFVRTLLWSANQ